MRTITFAKRNLKEIIRDPLSIIFISLLPLFLLFIFQQFNIPSDSYKLENFTPGIIIFSLSFITMFTSLLVSKDRKTSLLIRLKVSPMRPTEYIIGYTLSIIPIIICQDILLILSACLLGLKFTGFLLLAIPVSIIISLFFINCGILIGTLFSEKASSGISSIIIQLLCFTSELYFPIEALGKTFATICKYLPFYNALNIIKRIMNNNPLNLKEIIIYLIYTIISIIIVIIIFNKENKKRGKHE